MKRYIKTNIQNQITKIFTWYNRPEFDGSEIEFDNLGPDLTIEGKEVLNGYGYPVFTWDGSVVTEILQSDVDSDPDFIIYYKQLKKDELDTYVGLNLLDIITPGVRELPDIVDAWNNFKTNSVNWTTKQDIDTAFNNAITWLNT